MLSLDKTHLIIFQDVIILLKKTLSQLQGERAMKVTGMKNLA